MQFNRFLLVVVVLSVVLACYHNVFLFQQEHAPTAEVAHSVSSTTILSDTTSSSATATKQLKPTPSLFVRASRHVRNHSSWYKKWRRRNCVKPTKQDICLKEPWAGRDFNSVHVLAAALQYAHDRDENNKNSNNNHTRTRLLIPHKRWKWYQEWFDAAKGTPSWDYIRGIRHHCRDVVQCAPERTISGHYFYHNGGGKGRGYHPGFRLLRPFLRNDYWHIAQAQLRQYRDQIAVSTTTETPRDQLKVVTVHARGMEGKCEKRAIRGSHFCIIPQTNPKVAVDEWRHTCSFNESFVRQHLPPDFYRHNDSGISTDHVAVILFGDGQNNETESTFTIQDKSAFQVQVALMILSDYHFGNTQSSIDHAVAHWRQGKATYPESCYGTINQHFN